MVDKRHYWSKMNHDEARHSTELLSDAEAGRWLRGWLAGAGGNEASEEFLQEKPVEWRSGYSYGRISFLDVLEYSQKQSARVSKRYAKPTGSTAVTSGSDSVGVAVVHPVEVDLSTKTPTESTAVGFGSNPVDEIATGSLPDATNPTTNNQQLKEKEKKEKESRRAGFVPPTESEWFDYCKTNWPDWIDHRIDAAFARYQSVGWIAGKAKIIDWKSAARTAHSNAVEWGHTTTVKQAAKFRPMTLEEALVGVSPVRYKGGQE